MGVELGELWELRELPKQPEEQGWTDQRKGGRREREGMKWRTGWSGGGESTRAAASSK